MTATTGGPSQDRGVIRTVVLRYVIALAILAGLTLLNSTVVSTLVRNVQASQDLVVGSVDVRGRILDILTTMHAAHRANRIESVDASAAKAISVRLTEDVAALQRQYAEFTDAFDQRLSAGQDLSLIGRMTVLREEVLSLGEEASGIQDRLQHLLGPATELPAATGAEPAATGATAQVGDPNAEIQIYDYNDAMLDLTPHSGNHGAIRAVDALVADLKLALASEQQRDEMIHSAVGYGTLIILLIEAGLVFWPLLRRAGAESRRADLAMDELNYLARYDSLTGLFNRGYLERSFAHTIRTAQASDADIGVILIDLDRFKPINDTLGHAAGDEVLKRIAARLRDELGDTGTAGRLGGDEFVVLVPGLGNNAAISTVAARLLARIAEPIDVAGERIMPQASAGFALFPRDGATVQALISAADLALAEAKRSPSEPVSCFNPSMLAEAEASRRIETELRVAVAEDQFVVHFQPILNRSTGVVYAFEALVRWQHPRLGLVMPGLFISHLARAGVMVAVTQIVLEQSCRQLAAWHRAGFVTGAVHINVTEQFLTKPDLLAELGAVLARHGLAKTDIVLEITEDVAFGEDNGPVSRAVDLLHANGYRMALDDFGVGNASLVHLRKRGVDIIKIDRTFVKDLIANSENASILAAMSELGRVFGKEIVVEGIETEAQAEFLRIAGYDIFQGFLYSRPLPAEAATRFLESNRAALVRPAASRATG